MTTEVNMIQNQQADIDSIVMGETAKMILQRKSIMPRQWKLSPVEISRILQLGVHLNS